MAVPPVRVRVPGRETEELPQGTKEEPTESKGLEPELPPRGRFGQIQDQPRPPV